MYKYCPWVTKKPCLLAIKISIGPFQREASIARGSRCDHQPLVAVFWDEASGSAVGLDVCCRSLSAELSFLFLLSLPDRTGELKEHGDVDSRWYLHYFGTGGLGKVFFFFSVLPVCLSYTLKPEN